MNGRFDLFHSLDPGKQERIINAAFEEFGKKGFKHASTNAIVKKAGIGKGMLFYYFGSKEELFDFLCEYSIEFSRNTYMNDFVPSSDDFIERYRMMTELKRRVMKEMPEMVAFFESSYLAGNEQYFSKFKEGISEIKEIVMKKLYGGLDYSLFREDIEPNNILKYIRRLMDGHEADLVARAKNQQFSLDDEKKVEEEWARFYSFLDDLKKIFYRRSP